VTIRLSVSSAIHVATIGSWTGDHSRRSAPATSKPQSSTSASQRRRALGAIARNVGGWLAASRSTDRTIDAWSRGSSTAAWRAATTGAGVHGRAQ